MKYNTELDKIKFVGKVPDSYDVIQAQKWKNKKQILLDRKTEFKSEFKRLIRDQELHEEIKVTLKNADKKLLHAKIYRMYKEALKTQNA
jgi:hypothetical protein